MYVHVGAAKIHLAYLGKIHRTRPDGGAIEISGLE